MLRHRIPGLSDDNATTTISILQDRLAAYNDLSLTLKHVHWNVIGPNFIAVHEMLDPQIDLVRGYADEAAERIAALGGAPLGTVAAITAPIPYHLATAGTQAHLRELDDVYCQVIAANRHAIDTLGDLDPVSQDLVIGATGELEKFQWFVRAHLEFPMELPF